MKNPRPQPSAIPDIQPVLGQVLLLPDEVKKPVGIFLTDDTPLEPNRGIVLRSSSETFKPGDHVQWDDLSGRWVDDFILVNEDNILPMLIIDEDD